MSYAPNASLTGKERMMSKIEDAVKEAESLGWSKYVSDSGVRMVISTQDELDAVIRQAIESDRATRAKDSVCA